MKYPKVTKELQKWYRYANEFFFEGKLPNATIVLLSQNGGHSYVVKSNTWSNESKMEYEIYYSIHSLCGCTENAVSDLLHEMAHLYNMENNIKDVSRNGYYHNKKFYKTATEIAKLSIIYNEDVGFANTRPTQYTMNFICIYGIKKININVDLREMENDAKNVENNRCTKGKPKGSNSIKWVCPCCGGIARTTNKREFLGCRDCGEALIMVDDYKKTKKISNDKVSNGYGNFSYGERKCILYLAARNILFITQKTFDDLNGDSGKLRFDFYLPKQNLLIEINGEQHKNPIWGIEALETQERYDKKKREYAKKHNIKLIEIWYYDFDNLDEILNREL